MRRTIVLKLDESIDVMEDNNSNEIGARELENTQDQKNRDRKNNKNQNNSKDSLSKKLKMRIIYQHKKRCIWQHH